MILLTLKEQPEVPLEAEMLCPDVMAPLRNDAIRELPVYLGKRQRRLDDFFEVEGEASDEIEIRGNAAKVKWIGRRMTRGRITIAGNAGMHLGAYMKGGTIEVSGNVSDWLGAEMSGGLIRVHGNAGGQIGAAYRGSRSGMTDGTIIVDGTGGLEIGMRMKRGIIAIGGPVRDFAGLQMKGGTLVMRQGRRAPDRRLDEPGHDHLAHPDSDPADLLVRRHLQPHVSAALRQAPRDPRISRCPTKTRMAPTSATRATPPCPARGKF